MTSKFDRLRGAFDPENSEAFARLPKWAQEQMRTLKMRAEEAEKDAAQWKARLSGDTDEKTGVTLTGRWGEDDVRLPKHAQVNFQVDGGQVTVSYGMYGDLEVRTVGGLLVSPRASNVVTVEVRA